ncbi:Hypothetical predicted protein [Olea europaea subsp. europaea]|uniref:Uncharacterized protein n=1 Tax=Olea europaea subsp. europaea TaxID=158383 RepID=A0A8S0TTE2_OLEEU|nr:Hypothetical predicted protein [Olea europaea subsp. europaea]
MVVQAGGDELRVELEKVARGEVQCRRHPVRDHTAVLNKVKRIASSVRWKMKIVDHEEGPRVARKPTGGLHGGTALRTSLVGNCNPRDTASLWFYERRSRDGWRDEGGLKLVIQDQLALQKIWTMTDAVNLAMKVENRMNRLTARIQGHHSNSYPNSRSINFVEEGESGEEQSLEDNDYEGGDVADVDIGKNRRALSNAFCLP